MICIHLKMQGLVKFDLLGLKTLTVIDKTIKKIKNKKYKFRY